MTQLGDNSRSSTFYIDLCHVLSHNRTHKEQVAQPEKPLD